MSSNAAPIVPFADGEVVDPVERDALGRFQRGNPGGPGNPHARQVARLRTALLETVTEGDLRAIVAMLVQRARDGDIVAAKEVMDRCLGRSPAQPEQPAEDHSFTVIIE